MNQIIAGTPVFQMRVFDGDALQQHWVEVSEAEFHTPLAEPEKWEKRILYSQPQPVPPAVTQNLLEEARICAFVFEQIGSLDKGEIDGDDIELRFELEDADTGTNVSVTDYASRVSGLIGSLLSIIAANKSDAVTFELADLPFPFSAFSSSTDWQKGFKDGQEAYRSEVLALGPLFLAMPGREIHKDDIAFNTFAEVCKLKMEASRAKGRSGWDDRERCTDKMLARLLVDHTLKGNAGTFEDVATFAMMLHQRDADPAVLAEVASQGRLSLSENASRAGDAPLAYAYKELTPHFIRNHLSVYERYGIVPKDESVVIQALRIALDGMARNCATNMTVLDLNIASFFTATQNASGMFELNEECMSALSSLLDSGLTFTDVLLDKCKQVISGQHDHDVHELAQLVISAASTSPAPSHMEAV